MTQTIHGLLYIKSKCIRQTAQREAPYDVWILVTEEGSIETAGCQCIGRDTSNPRPCDPHPTFYNPCDLKEGSGDRIRAAALRMVAGTQAGIIQVLQPASQGHMGVSGYPWCDFVMYTKKPPHLTVERIYFRQEEYELNVAKAMVFYEKFVMPKFQKN
ncbi:hypothetical protein Pcinc_001170 [Petrolisthes cinctipes]|uniref:Uncharacterized protein n=1 Tax=Petrolisthes cinctipes TaxID=88211 RepID=A0AAE1K183_PETCI|nr:hypothetical protein Pcinc_032276 [Petrolisthes cinctipes]KAK3895074.1 hypothetical protein Pcinc_001170 [Petrolisthes cinctipes]